MAQPLTAASSAVEPTFVDLLRQGTALLASAGSPSARLDAEVLLAEACGVDRVGLLTRAAAAVPAPSARAYAALLQRRAARQPLAYLVGRKEFWSLELEVTPAVLVPRPETEMVVEIALGILRGLASSRPSVCDMCTGSGCIAVVIAREVPAAAVVGVDVSAAALDVARRNAVRHGVGDRLDLMASDLFTGLAGRRFDLVVANPPYVAAEELAGLEPELRCEPVAALDGGTEGLEIIRRLTTQAAGALVEGGWLVMEIGARQGPAVEALAAAAGFGDVRVQPDYAGLPRVLVAQVG